jgi:hypothetical protein
MLRTTGEEAIVGGTWRTRGSTGNERHNIRHIIIVTWWQRLIERFSRFWRQPCAVIATRRHSISCLMNGDRVAHSTSTRQWSVGKAR